MTQQELKNGTVFVTGDENPDYREAEVSYKQWHGDYNFHIWFNGVFIASRKSYAGIKSRLQQLCDKWGLTETDTLCKHCEESALQPGSSCGLCPSCADEKFERI